MNTRPFYDLVSALGAVIVNTNAQTYFNINGTCLDRRRGPCRALPTSAGKHCRSPCTAPSDNLSGITPTFNATGLCRPRPRRVRSPSYLPARSLARSGSIRQRSRATYLVPPGFRIRRSGVATDLLYDSVPVTLGRARP